MTFALLIAGIFAAAVVIAALIDRLTTFPDLTDACELPRQPSAHLELADRKV